MQSKTLLLFVADRLATLAVAVASQKVDFLKFVLKSLTEEKHTHTHGLLFVAYTLKINQPETLAERRKLTQNHCIKKVETLVVKTQPIDPLHKRPPSIFLSKPNQFAEIVCERLCPNETANYLFNGLFLLVKKVRTVSKNTIEKGQQNPRRITEKSFNSPNFDQIFILSPFEILFSTILRAVGGPRPLEPSDSVCC